MPNNTESAKNLKALMVAYHFPPIHGSSGYLRTLKFVKYLFQKNVMPKVLTVNPRAYVAVKEDMLKQVPQGVEVIRSFALDSQKHLSFKGKYFGWMSIPDRYPSWIPFAVLDGLMAIRKNNIDVIFSTYPIPSAMLIGLLLKKISKKTWVADFRDPMWDEYVETATSGIFKARAWIEKKSVLAADKITVTTQGIKDLFVKRYGKDVESKIVVIENGYDEEDFIALKKNAKSEGKIELIHTGLLEPVDRNPIPFFKALKMLLDDSPEFKNKIAVRFYASGHDDKYLPVLRELGLDSLVELLPGVSYGEALQKVNDSHISLIFQGKSCNNQIPAKLYEYLRIGNPILGMTTIEGLTGKTILDSGAGEVVSDEDSEAIFAILKNWLQKLQAGQPLPKVTEDKVKMYSREFQAEQLAQLMAEVA